MKAKLILLAEPILVSDEPIEDGDWRYNPLSDSLTNEVNGNEVFMMHTHGTDWRKVIAGIPGLPSIDFSALSEEDCKKIGWVDVEKLAQKEIDDYHAHLTKEELGDLSYSDYEQTVHNFAFIKGFKAAQSLNEKKFSEEEIIKAYEAGEEAGYVRGSDGRDDSKFLSIEELLQSLSQPKVFDVEVEMKLKEPYKDQYGDLRTNDFESKITNNSIKVIKVL